MSLSIHVGCLAYHKKFSPSDIFYEIQKTFLEINTALKKNLLNTYQEPEILSKHPMPYCDNYSNCFFSSEFSYLARVAAYALGGFDRPSTFLSNDQPEQDPVLLKMQNNNKSHLICFANYYVPIDFDHVIFGDVGMIGSSQVLLKELLTIAPYLNIIPASIPMSNIKEFISGDLGLERELWIMFYECAKVSVEKNTAIVLES